MLCRVAFVVRDRTIEIQEMGKARVDYIRLYRDNVGYRGDNNKRAGSEFGVDGASRRPDTRYDRGDGRWDLRRDCRPDLSRAAFDFYEYEESEGGICGCWRIEFTAESAEKILSFEF